MLKPTSDIVIDRDRLWQLAAEHRWISDAIREKLDRDMPDESDLANPTDPTQGGVGTQPPVPVKGQDEGGVYTLTYGGLTVYEDEVGKFIWNYSDAANPRRNYLGPAAGTAKVYLDVL